MLNEMQISFIQNILQATMGIEVNLFTPPYDNISAIDRSLRKTIWSNINYINIVNSFFRYMKHNVIYFHKDDFNSYYALFRLPDTTTDFLCIGPYLLEETTEEFYLNVIKKNLLTNDMLVSLKQYYSELPVVDSQTIISSTNAIGSFIFGNISNFKTQFTQGNFIDKDIVLDFTPNPQFSLTMNMIEERYKIENQLIEAISIGNSHSAKNLLLKLYTIVLARTQDPIRNEKNKAIILNTLCRKAAEKNYVHPIYLDDISTKFAIDLEKKTTVQSIRDLFFQMVDKYCILVQETSLKDYSPLIRRTINFTNFNMSKPISLRTIASEFNVNPNYLSTLFKKEVKLTLTQYINKQRIEISVKMLTATDMQIQDIASYVGIYDVNYFIKLFKIIIGYTPTTYKKEFR